MKKTLLAISAGLCTSLAMAQAVNYPNGSTVNDFTVTDTEGNVHNLYSYTSQGKYVMLDFFFDTCPPCQATSHYFSELHQTYGCNSEDLICISMNNGTDSNAEVEAFETAYGGAFAHPPAVATEGGCAAVDAAFGVSAYPTYCLIGPNNAMVNNDIWPLTDMSTFVAAFPTGSGITAAACAVGVQEAAISATTTLHPNPASDLVNVTISLPAVQRVELVLFDMLGQVQLTQVIGQITNTSSTLDVSALPNGNYIVKLMANGIVASAQRLTIAR